LRLKARSDGQMGSILSIIAIRSRIPYCLFLALKSLTNEAERWNDCRR
jgi:hypothetical protein